MGKASQNAVTRHVWEKKIATAIVAKLQPFGAFPAGSIGIRTSDKIWGYFSLYYEQPSYDHLQASLNAVFGQLESNFLSTLREKHSGVFDDESHQIYFQVKAVRKLRICNYSWIIGHHHPDFDFPVLCIRLREIGVNPALDMSQSLADAPSLEKLHAKISRMTKAHLLDVMGEEILPKKVRPI